MAEDSPSLSFTTDSDGATRVGKIVTFLQAGGDAWTVITSSIVGLVISPFIVAVDIIEAVGNFFATPFDEGGNAIGALLQGLFTAPANLVEAGATITENTLRAQLGGGLAGALALPITVGLVMISLWLIIQYLQEPETGDTIPGLPFDVPDIGPVQLGVDEEDPDEDEGQIG